MCISAAVSVTGSRDGCSNIITPYNALMYLFSAVKANPYEVYGDFLPSAKRVYIPGRYIPSEDMGYPGRDQGTSLTIWKIPAPAPGDPCSDTIATPTFQLRA